MDDASIAASLPDLSPTLDDLLRRDEAERLAEEHWFWLESLLHKIYVDAMVHGYGHGYEHGLEAKERQ